ncbi:uncharacterized protein [Pseudorca crassidens]|uniref:uncharacterized protein isoform X2 n=2 Tax=Pseudorca crassidens TaxID=82174 RepID=UPI00352C8B5A
MDTGQHKTRALLLPGSVHLFCTSFSGKTSLRIQAICGSLLSPEAVNSLTRHVRNCRKVSLGQESVPLPTQLITSPYRSSRDTTHLSLMAVVAFHIQFQVVHLFCTSFSGKTSLRIQAICGSLLSPEAVNSLTRHVRNCRKVSLGQESVPLPTQLITSPYRSSRDTTHLSLMAVVAFHIQFQVVHLFCTSFSGKTSLRIQAICGSLLSPEAVNSLTRHVRNCRKVSLGQESVPLPTQLITSPYRSSRDTTHLSLMAVVAFHIQFQVVHLFCTSFSGKTSLRIQAICGSLLSPEAVNSLTRHVRNCRKTSRWRVLLHAVGQFEVCPAHLTVEPNCEAAGPRLLAEFTGRCHLVKKASPYLLNSSRPPTVAHVTPRTSRLWPSSPFTSSFRREALTLAATWMYPENTMLSERSQTHKDTQGVTPLRRNFKNSL